eukprot:g29426.t1
MCHSKNCNDLLKRQTQDMTDRVPFIIHYFPRVEKLHHVLHLLLPNLKQAIVHKILPSLQDNIDHNTTQPCHGNLCKTCQIIDLDTTITRGHTF